mmetsp:Transcript_10681/g.15718  ORF Transcript_10681/g.15718 Transcript_10681/m.15718 type:complete len:196 (+) Transcript_10681:491-1078(+)
MNNVVNVATAQIDPQFPTAAPKTNTTGTTDVPQTIQQSMLKACGSSTQPTHPQLLYPKAEQVAQEGPRMDLFQRKQTISIDRASDQECRQSLLAHHSRSALDSIGTKGANSPSDIASTATFPTEGKRRKIDSLQFYACLYSDINTMSQSDDEANNYCKKLEFLIWAHRFLTASGDLIKKEKTRASVAFQSNVTHT